MDGSDPATWDPALDGVLAAPENHTVLYEDDLIRVISVRVAPGATEKPHHHRVPSVFVIDRMVKLRDFNGVTRRGNLSTDPQGRRFPDHPQIRTAAAALRREPRYQTVPRD